MTSKLEKLLAEVQVRREGLAATVEALKAKVKGREGSCKVGVGPSKRR